MIQTSLLDNFESGLRGFWKNGWGDGTPFSVSGGNAQFNGFSSGCYYEPTGKVADGQAWTTITTPPGASEQILIHFRARNPSGEGPPNTNVHGYWVRLTPGLIELSLFDGGIETVLNSASVTHAAGDTWVVDFQGSALNVSRIVSGSETNIVSATDGTLQEGWVGLEFIAGGAVSEFGGGAFIAGKGQQDWNRESFPFAPAEEFIWIGRGRPGRLGAAGLMRGTGPHPYGGFERTLFTRLFPSFGGGTTPPIDMPIDVALTLDTAVSRVVNRNISTALTLNAAVSRVVNRVISPALTLVSAVSRRVNRNISPALTLNTSVSRTVNRPISVTLTLSTNVTTARILARAINVGLTLNASVLRTVLRPIPVNLTLNSAVSRRVNRNISVTLTLNSAVSRVVNRAISVGLTLNSAVSRVVNRTIATALNFTPSVTVSRILTRGINATLTLDAAVSRRVNRTISVPLTMAAAVSRVVKRNLNVALTLAANVGNVFVPGGPVIYPISIPVTLTLNVSVSRVVKRTIAAPLLFAVNIFRFVPGAGATATRARSIILQRFGIY